MSRTAIARAQPAVGPVAEAPTGLLQRKCSCGQHTGHGECAQCRKNKLHLQRRANASGRFPPQGARGGMLPAGTAISQPGDRLEIEADRVANQVLRSPAQDSDPHPADVVPQPLPRHASPSGGFSLPRPVNAFMAPRFGTDFAAVRVHTDREAARMSSALDARAFTFGSDVYFAEGQYRPGTEYGNRLIAHELAHVVQQGGPGIARAASHALSTAGRPHIQRTLGDGHDLTSPRFSLLLDLEAAYDGEAVIKLGSTGRGVQAIQQALYDLGFPLPASGADGMFGAETRTAVMAFQTANPPLTVDGKVGPATMAALDARFGSAPSLPAAATLSAPWTEACVLDVLCPWSPHTIDVLRTRITLKSFDSISWADEEWDGASWIPAPFPGGGYNTGTEIGVLNSSCESMAETLYHEVLHAEQPTRHTRTLQKDSYAYRIGEEFSIAMGLGGRPALRSTDPQGRQFADPTLVTAFVSTVYPSVPSSGPAEEIIGPGPTHGEVEVRRADGSIYTRPAAVGEKVPGPITLVNEVVHSTAALTCP